MEKRRFERFTVQGEVEGNIVYTAEICLLDISLGGIRFLTTKRLNPEGSCRINLRHREKEVTLRGKIIWSIFKGTKKIDSEFLQSRLRYIVPGILKKKKIDIDFLPVYEVAVEFSPFSKETKASLSELIDQIKDATAV